ncbi:MAG: DUF6153 family protein [Stackebrandtia sp.]
MWWRHPAVRLLLIVLAFGVAGMHTLGHHGEHDGHSPAATMSAHGDQGQHGDGAAASSPTGDFDPTAMCLAILTATALLGLALAAGRLSWRVPPNRRRHRGPGPRPGTRDPPGVTPANLLLAEITVLRI